MVSMPFVAGRLGLKGSPERVSGLVFKVQLRGLRPFPYVSDILNAKERGGRTGSAQMIGSLCIDMRLHDLRMRIDCG